MQKILHAIREIKMLQLFTVYVRYLIGGAFVISTFTMNKFGQYGDVKKLANKIPINELPPAEVFFRLIAESGTYWHFIGFSQLISGILLMTQRFARLGALLYFIIILNIFIITIAFDFHGTPIITGLMLLAGLYLICWDVESLLPLIFNRYKYEKQSLQIADQSYWIFLGGIMLVSVFLLGIFYPSFYLLLLLPFLEGLLGFILFRILFWNKK
jgi:hypothetical protein